MVAAEDVERQVAVAVVIAVEEPALLVAVDRVVGGVEIERDPRRGLVVGLQEEIDEQILDRPRIMADAVVAMRPLGRMLQPVERALAGERRQARPFGLEPAEHGAEHRVAAQLVMIDQILVAERDPEHPLADQRRHLMHHPLRRAAVREAGGEAIHKPDRPVRRPQEQRPGIRGDRPAAEIRHQLATIEPCKQHRFCATLRLHRACSCSRVKSLWQKYFPTIRRPMHLLLVRYPG